MEVVISETNRKKKCLIYDGFTFRIDRILKGGDISWRCTNNKSKCKARVRTDGESKVVMGSMIEHNHDKEERKLESRQLRVMAKRKATDDITARPSKIIKQALQVLLIRMLFKTHSIIVLSIYLNLFFTSVSDEG